MRIRTWSNCFPPRETVVCVCGIASPVSPMAGFDDLVPTLASAVTHCNAVAQPPPPPPPVPEPLPPLAEMLPLTCSVPLTVRFSAPPPGPPDEKIGRAHV